MPANVTTEARVAALYEAHREEIYGFLVGQGLESGRAQELTQDAFVKLFVAIDKGTVIASERAWLYGVASKLAVDYWRREGRPMWVELRFSSDHCRQRAIERFDPGGRTGAEGMSATSRPDNGSSPYQRLGIHLRMQGLRYRAIAKILGVSVLTTADLLCVSSQHRLRSAADE